MWDGLDDLDLSDVNEQSELHDRAVAFSKSIGSSNFSYVLLRPPAGNVAKEEYALTDSPDEWLARYSEKNYKFYDPLAKICAQSRLPAYWGYRGFADHFEKAERIVLHEARAFNHVEGYVVPTAGPENDTGGLCFCVDTKDSIFNLVAESAARIQLFAAEFHAAAVRIFFDGQTQSTVSLTPREMEVLSWAANGLSSEATASKMGLTAPTVNYHVANCCRKLGATNKMQAVALAIRQNLI